ncbi:MAG: hypothetical protein J4G05_09930 [Chlorobi bacterium]|nr:hypothetical protein [Chlorobiota bacterium]
MLSLFIISACSEHIPDDPVEYQALLDDPESGMSKEKVVEDVRLQMQYMPPQFLAFKEAESRDEDYDKVLEHYQHGMSFVLQVDMKEGGQDIMGKDVQGYDDYRERVALLNFDIKNYVRLETTDTVIEPVLGTMENTYGLARGRKLIVVFPGDPESILRGSDRFDIIFDDPLFGTGINRFSYRTSDILGAPTPQT